MTDLLKRGRAAIAPVWEHRILGPALKVLLGYLLIVQGLLQYLFGKVPIVHAGRGAHIIPTEILLLGLVYGSLYALIGMGVILVYRANRIVNFAQAQLLGSVPAVIALLLIAKRGVPWIVALPIAVIGGALLGGAVEVGLIRRFSNAPRLILTVVTIGVGFLLLVLEVYSKQWVGGSLIDTVSLHFKTPFSGFEHTIGGFIFRGDHIAPVVVVERTRPRARRVLQVHRHRHRRSGLGRERRAGVAARHPREARVDDRVDARRDDVRHRRVLHRAAHRAAARRLRRSAPAAARPGHRRDRAHGELADRVRRRPVHRHRRPVDRVHHPHRRAHRSCDLARGRCRVARSAASCRGRWSSAHPRGKP